MTVLCVPPSATFVLMCLSLPCASPGWLRCGKHSFSHFKDKQVSQCSLIYYWYTFFRFKLKVHSEFMVLWNFLFTYILI